MDTSQAGQSDSPTTRTRFCTSCGEAAGGSRFCGGCGSPLGIAAETAPTVVLPHLPVQPTGGVPRGDASSSPAQASEGPQRDEDQETLQDLAADHDVLGLAWQDDAEVLPPARSRLALTRRQSLLAAAALVAVVALIAAGLAGSRYVADGDLRAALASSTRDFNGVVEALTVAGSAENVATAADQADTAAGRVDDALTRLGSVSGPEDSAVRAQLEAEKALLLAVAQLEGVGSDPLMSWGAAHDDLTAAMKTEDGTRIALERFHGDAARALADTALMLTKVTAAVGPVLVDDATDESTRLLKSLASAKTTADLRKLGDAAAPEQAAVAAAAQALPVGDGKQVLTGYAAALSALADLSKISAESTGGWAGIRAELAQTFGQVAAAAGSTGGANVRVVLDGALAASDQVVTSAAAAIADWKAKTDAAIKARGTDTEALESYSAFFRSQAKTYEQLRLDLSAFTKRVEDPGVYYYEAYSFMSQAAQDRRYVRDSMVASDVPAGVREAHQDVVSAIDRAISAVQSAYDGLEQSQDCYDYCPYYRDTPGWQRFLSESDGISTSYSSAMTRWETAVAASKNAIANRPLPAKPQV